jgi:hypothetical protein
LYGDYVVVQAVNVSVKRSAVHYFDMYTKRVHGPKILPRLEQISRKVWITPNGSSDRLAGPVRAERSSYCEPNGCNSMARYGQTFLSTAASL